MRRRSMAALGALVATVTLVVTGASPAAAAPLQDFYLASNNGTRAAAASGAVVTGSGTFVPTGPDSDTILLVGKPPVFMTRTGGAASAILDPRTCRVTVRETGAFEFTMFSGGATFGGSGPYTLTGSQTGTRLAGGGCSFNSPDLTQYTIIATATEIHAVA